MSVLAPTERAVVNVCALALTWTWVFCLWGQRQKGSGQTVWPVWAEISGENLSNAACARLQSPHMLTTLRPVGPSHLFGPSHPRVVVAHRGCSLMTTNAEHLPMDLLTMYTWPDDGLSYGGARALRILQKLYLAFRIWIFSVLAICGTIPRDAGPRPQFPVSSRSRGGQPRP